ncbi:MAG: GNAT family N-acetyltransferase [Chlamydiae bacterium]|nr:GNAT family N-acetyltransferase [Chlamydiota bacterium]
MEHDRKKIELILEEGKVFSKEEIACGLSLFDEYIRRGSDPNEYVFCCAYSSDKEILGLMCYGRVPLTDRVYDLYWIVTDTKYQGAGVGSFLMKELSNRLQGLKARMVLAETSSRVDYEKARRFYLRHGFFEVSTIQDYYAWGDDLIVYGKRYENRA